MSIPAGGLSVPAGTSTLLAPDHLLRSPLTTDYEVGGVAVGDASQGLFSTTWRVRVVGTQALLSASPYSTETVLVTDTGITEASLAFSQNMTPHLAYVAGGVAKLRWFDSVPSTMVTTTLATDVRSPFLTMDDKRESASATNDILMFYLRGNTLYYRQQRDRFQTEYTVRAFTTDVDRIGKAGMSTGLRLHVEVLMMSASRGA